MLDCEKVMDIRFLEMGNTGFERLPHQGVAFG